MTGKWRFRLEALASYSPRDYRTRRHDLTGFDPLVQATTSGQLLSSLQQGSPPRLTGSLQLPTDLESTGDSNPDRLRPSRKPRPKPLSAQSKTAEEETRYPHPPVAL